MKQLAPLFWSFLAAIFGAALFVALGFVLFAAHGPQSDGSNGYYYVAIMFVAMWGATFAAYHMGREDVEEAQAEFDEIERG